MCYANTPLFACLMQERLKGSIIHILHTAHTKTCQQWPGPLILVEENFGMETSQLELLALKHRLRQSHKAVT